MVYTYTQHILHIFFLWGQKWFWSLIYHSAFQCKDKTLPWFLVFLLRQNLKVSEALGVEYVHQKRCRIIILSIKCMKRTLWKTDRLFLYQSFPINPFSYWLIKIFLFRIKFSLLLSFLESGYDSPDKKMQSFRKVTISSIFFTRLSYATDTSKSCPEKF